MPQALAIAVLAGIVSGGLALAPLSGSIGLVLLAYFVQLPLLLAGLTMGLAATLIAALAAIMINGLLAGLLPALVFLLVFAAPCLLVVRQALLSRQESSGIVWYPPGPILAQLTAAAAAGILLTYLAFVGQPGGLSGAIETALAEAVEQLSAVTAQPIPSLEGLKARAWMIPAAVASSWLVMIALNGALAQAIAVRAGWNRRPSPTLASLELPSWLWPLMGVAALLAVLGGTDLGFLGRSMLVVLVVPFAFLGLAVIHKFAGRWTHRHWALAAIYAGIIIFNWPILAVVALGLVEDWAHLRRYM